jgi:hypothetical protein
VSGGSSSSGHSHGRDPYSKAAARVLRWCDWYTRGLPAQVAADRRDELLSDLHEESSDTATDAASRRALARSVGTRAVLGAAADLSWRADQLRQAPPTARRPARSPLPASDRRLLLASFVIGSLAAWATAFSAAKVTVYSNFSAPNSDLLLAATSGFMLLGLIFLARPRMRVAGAVALALCTLAAWWLFLRATVSWAFTAGFQQLLSVAPSFPVRLALAYSPGVIVAAFFVVVAIRFARSGATRRQPHSIGRTY